MSTIISGDGTITGLTATGISAVQNLPTGSVLQVQQAFTTTAQTLSGGPTALSSMTLTVTPKSASSKFLIFYSVHGLLNVNDTGFNIRIYRNGSLAPNTGGGDYDVYYSGTGSSSRARISNILYDSPASSSAVTYALYAITTSSLSITFNENLFPATLTVMEIA